MEIKLNLDVNEIISSAVSTDIVKPIIEKAIKSVIENAICSATGHNSAFRKGIEQQIKEAMPCSIQIDDVAKFHQVALAELNQAVHGANSEIIKDLFKETFSRMIPNVPAQVKLSDLIKSARNNFYNGAEGFYACLEEDSKYGGGWFSLDNDPDCRSDYLAKIRLGFNKDGDVFSLRLDNENITPNSRPDIISKFDATLLSMYVGKTSLIIDINADEVEELAQSQED